MAEDKDPLKYGNFKSKKEISGELNIREEKLLSPIHELDKPNLSSLPEEILNRQMQFDEQNLKKMTLPIPEITQQIENLPAKNNTKEKGI